MAPTALADSPRDRGNVPRPAASGDCSPVGGLPLLSRTWNERIDALVDDLIADEGVEAAFLASILMTAQESIRKGEHVALSLRIWNAHNDLDTADDGGPPTPPKPRGRLGRRSAV